MIDPRERRPGRDHEGETPREGPPGRDPQGETPRQGF